MSLILIATPVAILLMSFTASSVWKVLYEEDEAQKMLYGYDSKIQISITILTCVLTVCYIISTMMGLYFIEKHADNKEGKLVLINESID